MPFVRTVCPPPFMWGERLAQRIAEWYSEQARNGKLLRTTYAAAVKQNIK